MMTSKSTCVALRGAVLSFSGDPFQSDLDTVMHYESDGLVWLEDGRIKQVGPAVQLLRQLPAGMEPVDYRDCLILPGFIDCHTHYPQLQVIGAFGEQLIDWLNRYAYVTEQAFGDPECAHEAARIFLRETLRAGTTTAAVYCTVHSASVDSFFEESERLNMRNIAGKLLMDRNAPEPLLDSPQRGYDESKALINKWHGRGRQLYAITPRFAATSSAEQMEMAGALWSEHPGTYLQSHIAENRDEMTWVKQLYPERADYLDVYEHYGLLGPRAIYGHGIHLTESELQRCYETGTGIAHCPTSNFFLGSGCFDLGNAKRSSRPVRVGLASDVGAGTSLSMLQTLNEAYKAAQFNGFPLNPAQAFYLATRGSAEALYLEERIGGIAPGMEADLLVLDLHSTPLIEYRMRHAGDLMEALFIQMTLADERATRATYLAGSLVYERD
ncbi:guanine deaminase [Candidatus Endoriftia persephone]|nr:guanine deaminase [Candidatus Endoriftia persephone]USF86821.1 guanine deaminase [Candidatus Endoriftia persephone]